MEYECPQLSLLIITSVLDPWFEQPKTQNQCPIPLSHANVFKSHCIARYSTILRQSIFQRLLWTRYFSQSKLSESQQKIAIRKYYHNPQPFNGPRTVRESGRHQGKTTPVWPERNPTTWTIQKPPPAHQTTSFLTATTLIYAIGAGITAAAGTRLALQWILVKGFRLYSFQLPDKMPGIVIYCHYLPVSGLGNLRACCLPWMW